MKILLAAGSVLVALLIFEVGLRFSDVGHLRPELQFDRRTNATMKAGRYAFDRDLFWRLADDQYSDYEKKIHAVQRGVSVPPKGNRFRIVCLGDSCTKLSRGRPYSLVLGEKLGAQGVDVLNAGLPAYTSHQGLKWLQTRLLDLEPDLVFVYFGWNDHWRSTGMTDRDYAATLVPTFPRLLNLIRRRADPPPVRVPLASFRENLKEIVRITKERGAQPVLIVPPANVTPRAAAMLQQHGNVLRGENVVELHRRYQDVTRELGRTGQARVIDAAELFARSGRQEEFFWKDGIHLTEAGHEFLGTILAKHVAQLDPPTGPTSDP